MPPRLSVAMIVKNEALLLTECLQYCTQYADECVVVDTGSTDDTRNIAEAAGCTLMECPWQNDFSQARNISLDACTGDWILVLDADERIAAEDWEALRGLIDASLPKTCYRLCTRNYTDNTTLGELTWSAPDDAMARQFPAWFPSTKVRLFPKHPDIRFENPVHELVNESALRAGYSIVDCNIPIHHYPLLKDAAALEEKRKLYLELGKAKVNEQPHIPEYHAELGHQYMELGQFRDALEAYQKAVSLSPQTASFLTDLGGALHVLDQLPQAEQAFRLALEQDPNAIDAWRNLGVIQGNAGIWEEAEVCFANACTLDPNQAEAQRHHALALQGLGRIEEAKAAAQRALTLNPGSAEAQDLVVTLARY